MRNLIARGMVARELDETIAEVRAVLPEPRATEGGGTWGFVLEVPLEVRAMLRAIAAVRDPLILTNAREQARKELAASAFGKTGGPRWIEVLPSLIGQERSFRAAGQIAHKRSFVLGLTAEMLQQCADQRARSRDEFHCALRQ